MVVTIAPQIRQFARLAKAADRRVPGGFRAFFRVISMLKAMLNDNKQGSDDSLNARNCLTGADDRAVF
jgi:hypothetical protein